MKIYLLIAFAITGLMVSGCSSENTGGTTVVPTSNTGMLGGPGAAGINGGVQGQTVNGRPTDGAH